MEHTVIRLVSAYQFFSGVHQFMNWDAGAVVRVAFIAGREDRAHPAIRLSTLNSDAATNKGEDGNFMQTASPLETV